MTSVILAPINFDNHQLLTEIIPELQNTSRMEFFIKPLILDIADAYSFERRQYYSTKILKLLLEKMSEEESKVIGIIKFDLFIPVLTYVFGEAQFDGKCSLVSLFRFHEEFYSSNSDTNLLKKRIIKEILHELGHNFGLIHCKDWECVMHSSSSIEEVDIKGSGYCNFCNQKIFKRVD